MYGIVKNTHERLIDAQEKINRQRYIMMECFNFIKAIEKQLHDDIDFGYSQHILKKIKGELNSDD